MVKEYFTGPRILALSVVSASIIYCVSRPTLTELWQILSFIGAAMFGITGLISLSPRLDKYVVMGVILSGFGFLMIFKFVPYPDLSVGVQVAIQIVKIVIGLYCILLSFPVFCGSRYDVKRGLTVSIICLILMGLPIVLEVGIYRYNFFELVFVSLPDLLIFIPFVLYIFIAGNANVGYKTRKYRFRQNVNSLSNVIMTDPNTYVMRKDLMKVRDVDEWEPFTNGYVVSRVTVPLYTSRTKNYLEGQKWKDGTIRVTISQGDTGTLMVSARIEMSDIIPDNGDFRTCKYMTMYTKSGFFARIMIKDDEIKKDVSKYDLFLYKLMGYDDVER